mmetsp:Transcript_22255/g.26742  ORF Transcript_22255/g.26742 Transcript_22255/m.26742 type:complete len:80 (+) Transcript_22255:427-666(+)
MLPYLKGLAEETAHVRFSHLYDIFLAGLSPLRDVGASMGVGRFKRLDKEGLWGYVYRWFLPLPRFASLCTAQMCAYVCC